MSLPIHKIKHDGIDLFCFLDKYLNGSLCVKYRDGFGMPYATLSVNVVGSSEYLDKNEFFAKNYSENREIYRSALESGYYEITDMVTKTGFVELQALKLKE